MKIDFGTGIYVEPETAIAGPHHRAIVVAHPVPKVRDGYRLVLSCGHHAMAFGTFEPTRNYVHCLACRETAERRGEEVKGGSA